MVPENIRKVPRPKNTVVLPTKHDNIYMVQARVGCTYDKGRRLPKNGKIVGHIIDGKYVAKSGSRKRTRLSKRKVSVIRYANIAFAESMGNGLLKDLEAVYDAGDAKNIYCLALMRAAFGDIKDCQISRKFHECYASILYPEAAVSKNSISRLLSLLGRDYKGMHDFMENRVKELVTEQTKVLVDGMLKTDTSQINSFAGFSYKGRIKGVTDVSIIVAIDAEKKEPICIKMYKGNLPDFVNCADFFDEFSIKGGLVISDKGFPLSKALDRTKDSKIGFLNPIKRSSRIIRKLGLLEDRGFVECAEKDALGKMAQDPETKLYYYSFLDLDRETKEEHDYVKGKKKKLEPKKFQKKKDSFGTVTFVSNMKLTLPEVYQYYALRWEIELLFKTYKSVLSMTTTREHDDDSVIGSEFVNFLSVIMTCRMKNKLAELGYLSDDSYGDMLDRLTDITKASIDPELKEWTLCTMNAKDDELLEKLGLK